MATIIFCIHPISGAVNASLKTAKDLQSRGHQVSYLGVADCEELVRPNEVEFIPIFEKWFPKGYVAERKRTASFTGLDAIREGRKTASWFKSFMDALIAEDRKEFQRIVEKKRPDLMIIVPSTYHSLIWALLAYEAGIKSIYFHDTLGRSADAVIPPITCDFIPDDRLLSKIRTTAAWQRFFLERFFYRKLFSVLGMDLNWTRIIKKLAADFKYPIEQIDMSDLVSPKLKLPELVPFPAEFDFPHPEKVNRYYIEPSIDLKRKQIHFPWEKLDSNCPLIYCALGSLPYLKKHEYQKFFQIVIEVARLHENWQWVLSVGNELDEDDFESVGANVIIMQRCPQLELLKRAYIMITHGGTNSVMECIFFGVPMVVFPLGFDHPGTAARVVFHGLGVRGDIRKTTTESLQSLITTVDKHSCYQSQARIMQRAFQEKETAQPGLQIIETLIGQKRTNDYRY